MIKSKLPLTLVYKRTTIEGRWREAVLRKESLRLEYNAVGKQFADGLIDRETWEAFKDDEWEPRMDYIHDELHAHHMAVIDAG